MTSFFVEFFDEVFFAELLTTFLSCFSPTFLGSFCRLFVDFLVTIFVEFYATFVDLKEFSVSSEASQNGCLCHSYCTRSQYLD